MNVVSGLAAQRLLEALRVKWPHAIELTTEAHLEGYGTRFGTMSLPVVVKAEGLAHRSQAGGVWRNVVSAEDMRHAIHAFASHFGYPISVVEQIAHTDEFAAGAQRLPSGDLAVMFGRGGGDIGDAVEFLLAPVRPAQAYAVAARYIESENLIRKIMNVLRDLEMFMKRRTSGSIDSVDINPLAFDSHCDLWALDAKVFLAQYQ